jgi:hypothetical protein
MQQQEEEEEAGEPRMPMQRPIDAELDRDDKIPFGCVQKCHYLPSFEKRVGMNVYV